MRSDAGRGSLAKNWIVPGSRVPGAGNLALISASGAENASAQAPRASADRSKKLSAASGRPSAENP